MNVVPVVQTDRFVDRADREYLRIALDGPSGAAFAWLNALQGTLRGLSAGATARPLCLDPRVQGLGLREAYFGAGGRATHRLIFRVTPAAVEVLTVRGLSQDDLTPADL